MRKGSNRPVPTGQKHKERTEHNMLLFFFKAFHYGGGLMAATAEDARAAFDRLQANGWGR